MKPKQYIGLAIIIIGVVLAIFAFNGGRQLADMRKNINKGSGAVPKNPISNMIQGSLEDQLSSYDKKVLLGEVAGVALIVIGGVVVYYYRKKR